MEKGKQPQLQVLVPSCPYEFIDRKQFNKGNSSCMEKGSPT